MPTIFPFIPQLPITEKVQFVNTVLTAYNSSEQRINKEDIPTSIFSIEILNNNKVANFLRAMLLSKRDESFYFPLWVELTNYTNDITSGSSSITFDTKYARYQSGSYLIIFESEFKNEVLTIDTVTDTTVTFTGTVQNDYTDVKYVMPAFVGYINSDPSSNYYITNTERIPLTFICQTTYEIEDWTSKQYFNTYPMLLDCEVFSSDTGQNKYIGSLEIINIAGGVISPYNTWEYSKGTRSFGFKKYTKEDIWEFRKFLSYLKGRFKPLYIPSFKSDLISTGDILATDKFINIENNGYADLLNDMDVRKYIIIFYEDTYIIKKILNFTSNDTDTEICNLTREVDVNLTKDNFKISFLIPYRASADTFDITWNNLNYITCNSDFTEEYFEKEILSDRIYTMSHLQDAGHDPSTDTIYTMEHII